MASISHRALRKVDGGRIPTLGGRLEFVSKYDSLPLRVVMQLSCDLRRGPLLG